MNNLVFLWHCRSLAWQNILRGLCKPGCKCKELPTVNIAIAVTRQLEKAMLRAAHAGFKYTVANSVILPDSRTVRCMLAHEFCLG